VITRFQRCVGIKLFRFNTWQLEIWVCPKNEVIPLHYHAHCDSRIIHLFGEVTWRLVNKTKTLKWFNIGWNRVVKSGVYHGATVHTRFGIFANLEHWKTKPTSAGTDFVYG